jgi:hypothetical protein
MILYKDNPDLGLITVTTFDGNIEYKRNCRLILKKYYVKEKDVFFIESVEKWYRLTTNKIFYDNELKKWELFEKCPQVIHGVIDIDSEGNSVKGHFTENKYNNVRIVDSKSNNFTAINEEILKNFFIENNQDSIFYHKSLLSSSSIKDMKKYYSRDFKNKGYNIEDNTSEFETKKDMLDKYPVKITENVKKHYSLLSNITWGIEAETSIGYVPERHQLRNGMVYCRDGSISGGEAVSVPFSGAKGLQSTVNMMDALKKYCDTDIKCSLHIHIGTIPTSKHFLVALYMLVYNIQDEMLRMFPYYKTEPGSLKSKNYCQKLKKLSIFSLLDFEKGGYEAFVDDTYNKIFKFLSDGHEIGSDLNRTTLRHPQTQKWNRPSRLRYSLAIQ